jgi:hypothetical protein
MSGDVSGAADVNFPDAAGWPQAVIIRQSLNDDSKEAMVALHGAGLMHLAWRPEKGKMMTEIRVNERQGLPDLVVGKAKRIGIEKHGDVFALYVSVNGEPMHQVGETMKLHFTEPFYVGIGFCSHLPAIRDTTLMSKVVLENAAGKVK